MLQTLENYNHNHLKVLVIWHLFKFKVNLSEVLTYFSNN